MTPRAYRPHTAFAAPALSRAEMWRLVVGFFLIELGYRLTYALTDTVLPSDILDAFYSAETSFWLTAQLFSFAALALSTILVTRYLHARNPLTLIGPPAAAWRSFRAALLPVLGVLCAMELLPPYWQWDALAQDPAYVRWLLWMPLAVSAIFIQIAAEELLYRGYLQQQLAAIFANPLIWMVLTNLIFGLAHYEAGAGGAASVQYVIWAFFMGLVCSDLTARTGSLGPALAMHFANNLFAFTLYGEVGGGAAGYALFLFPEGTMGESFETPPDQILTWQLVLELFALLLMWTAGRIGLKR